MPSPSAKRTKPAILIGPPALPSALLDRLRHALLVVEDEALIEQADFFVEGLEAGLDDLVDHVRRFALRLEFVREHVLLALDGRRDRGPEGSIACGLAEATCIATMRPKALSSSALPVEFERHEHADAAEAVGTELCT